MWKIGLAYIQFYLFNTCYWHFIQLPSTAKPFKSQLNPYFLLRGWFGVAKEKRFPSPVTGHNSQQAVTKKDVRGPEDPHSHQEQRKLGGPVLMGEGNDDGLGQVGGASAGGRGQCRWVGAGGRGQCWWERLEPMKGALPNWLARCSFKTNLTYFNTERNGLGRTTYP